MTCCSFVLAIFGLSTWMASTGWEYVWRCGWSTTTKLLLIVLSNHVCSMGFADFRNGFHRLPPRFGCCPWNRHPWENSPPVTQSPNPQSHSLTQPLNAQTPMRMFSCRHPHPILIPDIFHQKHFACKLCLCELLSFAQKLYLARRLRLCAVLEKPQIIGDFSSSQTQQGCS